MKFLIIVFSCFIFQSNMMAQDEMTLVEAIDFLSDNEKSAEATRSLYQTAFSNPDTLKPYKEELFQSLNTILSGNEAKFESYNLALVLYQNELFDLKVESEKALIKKHRLLKTEMKQTADYHTWIWEDDGYMEKRSYSALYLDLLGYCKSDASQSELTSSLRSLVDNKLKFYAAASLMQRNETVDAEVLKVIASDDEGRSLLFYYLESVNKLDLFPKDYLNQEDLSRADMVHWLIFPTELAHVPTEIKLFYHKTVKYDDVGFADYYIWQFRSDQEDWKDEEWMLGVSGPFIQSESPSLGGAYTFSTFINLDERAPEEIFDELVEKTKNFNEGH